MSFATLDSWTRPSGVVPVTELPNIPNNLKISNLDNFWRRHILSELLQGVADDVAGGPAAVVVLHRVAGLLAGREQLDGGVALHLVARGHHLVDGGVYGTDFNLKYFIWCDKMWQDE